MTHVLIVESPVVRPWSAAMTTESGVAAALAALDAGVVSDLAGVEPEGRHALATDIAMSAAPKLTRN
jgi:hypothetical protein